MFHFFPSHSHPFFFSFLILCPLAGHFNIFDVDEVVVLTAASITIWSDTSQYDILSCIVTQAEKMKLWPGWKPMTEYRSMKGDYGTRFIKCRCATGLINAMIRGRLTPIEANRRFAKYLPETILTITTDIG